MSAKGQTVHRAVWNWRKCLKHTTRHSAASCIQRRRRTMPLQSFPVRGGQMWHHSRLQLTFVNRWDSFRSWCRRRAARDRQAPKSNVKSFPMHEFGNTIQRCHVTGNQPSRGGKQRLKVPSTRTRIKENAGSQTRTSYFKVWRRVHKGSECAMCVHLCGILEAEEKADGAISARDLLENISAYGCFNSSRPVSLPQRSSPLNRIDYWFLLSLPTLLSVRPYFL